MSIPGTLIPLFNSGAGGYQISRSLRFNSSDSAYLSRTPASAGTSRTTWTISLWLKRAALGTAQWIFFSSDLTANTTAAYFTSSDTLEFYEFQSGSYVSRLITTQVFRDTSAWYHFTFTWDTTNGTSSDRARIYVNGQRIENFSTNTYPSSSVQSRWNNNVLHYFSRGVGSEYFSGYLAECIFVDGQALTPSSFTETDATTGQLIPKAFSGTYGTNGFHLPFSDNSTAAALGTDTSGNGNTWTVSPNISVAAGAGNDSLVDSPTNYGTDDYLGGSVRGNYATWNPLATSSSLTLANGNLQINGAGGSGGYRANTTIAVSSGKWYWEFTVTTAGNYSNLGIGQNNLTATDVGVDALSYAWQVETANKINNSSSSSYGSAATTGDVIMFALDLDNNKFYAGKNGTWFASGNPVTGANPMFSVTSGTYTVAARPYINSGSCQFDLNTGARPFAYTAPSGFKALCTQNLTPPTGVVAQPSTVMNVVTYSGTGSSLTLPNGSSTPTSISFTPDLIWIKGRSGATDHALYDAVRDVQKDLVSNSTAAETTQATGLTAFGTNTFTVGTLAKLNTSSSTYAAWCWDAGTTTVTLNPGDPGAGSITSSVRANASAGFSVVTYTGTGSAATVGHGLGVAPSLLIVKQRNAVRGWSVYHKDIGASYYLQLERTDAKGGPYSGLWNDTAPTSTVFSILNDGGSNANGGTYVAYCFAPVVGYSAMGSYVGNGSSDGPMVFTGMRPRFLLVKRSDASGEPWVIHDTARDSYNGYSVELYPNNSNAEGGPYTPPIFDFLSNGFKIRSGSATAVNASGGTFVWAAFAESPFQTARAR